jgi:signal transduction histidine kinase/ActR/RegA family two-component response regulator
LAFALAASAAAGGLAGGVLLSALLNGGANLPLAAGAVLVALAALLSSAWLAHLVTQLLAETIQAFAQDRLTMAASAESERLAAIAHTAQLLAHDLRKPFSLMRMGLGLLNGESRPERLKALVERMLPQIDTAMQDATNLVHGIMEAAERTTPRLEDVSARGLLVEVVRGHARLAQTPGLTLGFSLAHTRQLVADRAALAKALARILDNAVERTPAGGRLWIETRDVTAGSFVEIIVGNSGSKVEDADRTQVFDAFFTKGKRQGAGLGLTHARNVAQAHGGTIDLRNRRDGTELVMTIPASAAQTDCERVAPPASSCELARTPVVQRAAPPPAAPAEPVACRAGPLRVLIVDDEPLYSDAVHALAPEGVSFGSLSCGTVALERAADLAPDVLILDIDLGRDSPDGYQLLEQLRGKLPNAVLCMHSNRSLAGDLERAQAMGADFFLPKPMSAQQLSGLLTSASQRKEAACQAARQAKPRIAVVDDDVFVLEAWEIALGSEVEVCAFPEPEAFWRRFEQDGLGGAVDLVITDYYFGEGERENGRGFAEQLKARLKVPVLLSSDGVFDRAELTAFDGVIAKNPTNYAAVRRCLGSFALA